MSLVIVYEYMNLMNDREIGRQIYQAIAAKIYKSLVKSYILKAALGFHGVFCEPSDSLCIYGLNEWQRSVDRYIGVAPITTGSRYKSRVKGSILKAALGFHGVFCELSDSLGVYELNDREIGGQIYRAIAAKIYKSLVKSYILKAALGFHGLFCEPSDSLGVYELNEGQRDR